MKNLTWQNPEQLFVAQELMNKVKSKCCGNKVDHEIASFHRVYRLYREWLFAEIASLTFRELTTESLVDEVVETVAERSKRNIIHHLGDESRLQ